MKLFRIQFHRNALFVNFPYHPESLGIYARCTAEPGHEPTVDVAEDARKTNRKIKYSHPIDGQCHFSQSGQIITAIRNTAPRLDDGAAHLFTVDIQGVAQFASFSRAKRGEAYTGFFDRVDQPPKQLHVVARWMPLSSEEIDRQQNPLEVRVPSNNGYEGVFIACAPPSGSQLDGHLLLLELYSVQPLATQTDFLLLFIGGFGAELGNPSTSADFLFMQYPAGDVPGMAIGDFIFNSDAHHE